MNSLQRYDVKTDPVTGLQNSATESVHYVSWRDLPLACPMPGTSLWNGHPRVYLSIHQDGRGRCPYCATVYILRDPKPDELAPHFTNLQIERLYRQALARSEHAAAG